MIRAFMLREVISPIVTSDSLTHGEQKKKEKRFIPIEGVAVEIR